VQKGKAVRLPFPILKKLLHPLAPNWHETPIAGFVSFAKSLEIFGFSVSVVAL
jgi:hypothetical protein